MEKQIYVGLFSNLYNISIPAQVYAFNKVAKQNYIVVEREKEKSGKLYTNKQIISMDYFDTFSTGGKTIIISFTPFIEAALFLPTCTLYPEAHFLLNEIDIMKTS